MRLGPKPPVGTPSAFFHRVHASRAHMYPNEGRWGVGPCFQFTAVRIQLDWSSAVVMIWGLCAVELCKYTHALLLLLYVVGCIDEMQINTGMNTWTPDIFPSRSLCFFFFFFYRI